MPQKGLDMQDVEYGERPVDNWIPPYTIEEIQRSDRWRDIISEEEISELLSEINKEDPYEHGAAWQHKDGGMYEIIKKIPYVVYESIDESLSISRNVYLVWYRVRFADKLNHEVYVRTQEHFEKSFSWVPESDLM